MRIAVLTFDVPGEADVFHTCGSEARWALNWAYLLREQGHKVIHADNDFFSSELFDLYFQTIRHPRLSCGAGNVLHKEHVHLNFGLPNAEYFSGFECNKQGIFAYPNWESMSVSNENVLKHGYREAFLPTPYPESLKPKNLNEGFRRKEITWMLKRVWAHSPLSGHELYRDSYVDVAVWTLEAIRDLSFKYDLRFNYVKENFYGWGMQPMPPAAQRVLESIRGLNYLENLDFRGVLELMSRSKVSISIAGLTGSALESVFCDGVPLGYTNPVSTNENWLIPTTLTHVASSRGLTLPTIDLVSKQDITEHLEALWTDEKRYADTQQAFIEAFSYHEEDHCLQRWQDFCQKFMGGG